jgi:aspartyl-tRNA(Asn)/glutamyl-tRNA(Gln) amidotransferase subunit A
MTNALHDLTLAQAAELLRTRKLSPLEYVDHQIARVEALDGQLSAFITPTFAVARQQAQTAEAQIMAGDYRGPMHGVPFGAKDIYETAGILTTGGSRTAQHYVPTKDAAVVSKLYQAGAVLMGKLNTHEFAHGGPSLDLPWAPVRNPWGLDRFSGGSSSGSGAAVAAGFVPAALGTDTGGSIRGPASLCGIAGFMPSSGLVSRTGVMPNSFTFDHCGPMAWTVEDCALMLQAIAGHDRKDGNSFEQPIQDYKSQLAGGVKGLRIGVLRHWWEEENPANPEHLQALERAIDTFKQLGAHVADCRVRSMQDYMDVKVVIAETEIFAVHQNNLISRPGDFGHDFLSRILPASLFQSVDYLAATREHRRMINEMQPIYEKFDLLLMPTFGPASPITAHRPITFWQRGNSQVLANVSGGPALAVCCGFNTVGLPMGLQLVGAPQADALVLRAGHTFELAAGLRAKRPTLVAGNQAPALAPQNLTPDTSGCDAATRELALRMAKNAGLKLNEAQTEILLEAAPYAFAMAQRLRKNRNWFEEPANVFRT